MQEKRRSVVALLATLVVLALAAQGAGWIKPKVLHAQDSVVAHYNGPDQEAPDGSYPWACPSEYYFNTQIYADHLGTRYFFWLRYGALKGWTGIGAGTYDFGDVKSTNGAATLVGTFMFAQCSRVDGPDDWTLYVIGTGYGSTALRINTTPYTTSSPVQTGHTYQSDTYCLFRNYYDDDWNYLYSEEIPGSCWTVETWT